MKRLLTLLLAGILLLLPCADLKAWNSFRNEEGLSGANTIQAATPLNPQTTGSKWTCKLGTPGGGSTMNSSPVVTESNIYLVSKNILYKLDKNGNILATLTLASSCNSVCNPATDGSSLYIPLGGGLIQCVDMESFTTLWISESFGGQSLSTVYLHNGYVYAATTNGNGTEGCYYCLRTEDGSTVWIYSDPSSPCGFYWSGAISVAKDDFTCLLFGGDNGILVSHSLTSDEVYDQLDLSSLTGSKGKIRAGITYDAETDAYYTTSNNGYVYQIRMEKNGRFGTIKAAFLGADTTKEVNCTSTPTIYNNRLYLCSYYDAAGQVNVLDSKTMQLIYTASAPGIADIKSSPLISTGYASVDNSRTVYVYFTQNKPPGGIYYIEDHENATSSEIKTLYEPLLYPQFCLQSVVADSEGTLYYSNDSGAFFALHEGFASPETAPPTPEPIKTSFPTPVPVLPQKSEAPIGTTSLPVSKSNKTKQKKPGKPTKIRTKVKKLRDGSYRLTLTWKKGKNSKKTQIIVNQKQKKLVSGSKKQFHLKRGTYQFAIYGYLTPSRKSLPARIRVILN